MSKYGEKLQRFAIWKAYEGICPWCKMPITFSEMHIDHIIPRKLKNCQDLNDMIKFYDLPVDFDVEGIENLNPMHSSCNQQKSNVCGPPGVVSHFLEKAKNNKKYVVKYFNELLDEWLNTNPITSPRPNLRAPGNFFEIISSEDKRKIINDPTVIFDLKLPKRVTLRKWRPVEGRYDEVYADNIGKLIYLTDNEYEDRTSEPKPYDDDDEVREERRLHVACLHADIFVRILHRLNFESPETKNSEFVKWKLSHLHKVSCQCFTELNGMHIQFDLLCSEKLDSCYNSYSEYLSEIGKMTIAEANKNGCVSIIRSFDHSIILNFKNLVVYINEIIRGVWDNEWDNEHSIVLCYVVAHYPDDEHGFPQIESEFLVGQIREGVMLFDDAFLWT